MDCKTATESLSPYLDQEIDETGAAMLQTHLDGCASCRTELNRLRAVHEFLGDAEPIPVRAVFAADLMARARSLSGLNQNSIADILGDLLGWWRRAGRGLRLATATTAISGLVVGLVLGDNLAPNLTARTVNQGIDSGDVYSLDFLGDSPQGSLTDVYLTIMEAREGEAK